MSLVTPSIAREMGADGGLSDAALQRLIEREEAEIIRRFGAHWTGAAVSETVHGGGAALYLKRAATSISSIIEYVYPGDTAPVTLTASDYYLWPAEGRIERLPWGSSASTRWGTPVTVSYIPADDSYLRTQVILELIRIGAAEDASAGGGSVSGLGYSISGGSSSSTWQGKRNDQYARLGWLSR